MPPHFQCGYIQEAKIFFVQLVNDAFQILFHGHLPQAVPTIVGFVCRLQSHYIT